MGELGTQRRAEHHGLRSLVEDELTGRTTGTYQDVLIPRPEASSLTDVSGVASSRTPGPIAHCLTGLSGRLPHRAPRRLPPSKPLTRPAGRSYAVAGISSVRNRRDPDAPSQYLRTMPLIPGRSPPHKIPANPHK